VAEAKLIEMRVPGGLVSEGGLRLLSKAADLRAEAIDSQPCVRRQ